jgi:hypothetical protein
MAAAFLSMAAVVVVFLVGALTGIAWSAEPPLSWLFHPAAVLVVPVVAFLVSLLATIAHRRRHR